MIFKTYPKITLYSMVFKTFSNDLKTILEMIKIIDLENTLNWPQMIRIIWNYLTMKRSWCWLEVGLDYFYSEICLEVVRLRYTV